MFSWIYGYFIGRVKMNFKQKNEGFSYFFRKML